MMFSLSKMDVSSRLRTYPPLEGEGRSPERSGGERGGVSHRHRTRGEAPHPAPYGRRPPPAGEVKHPTRSRWRRHRVLHGGDELLEGERLRQERELAALRVLLER